MTGNICNYLFQLFTGRYLSTVDFGILNSLFSLFVITSVPGNAILLTTAKSISDLKALKNKSKIEKVVTQILFYTICLSCIFFALGFVFRGVILKFLSITDSYAYLIILVSMVLTLPLMVFMGILQGRQKFLKLGIFNAGQAIIKLLLVVIAIVLGLSFRSVMTSTAISIIIILVTIFHFSKKELNISKSFSVLTIDDEVLKMLKYVVPSFIAMLCFTIMTNIDMILVKHYFSGHEAGVYATSAMFGKIILYFPGAIVMAMFPMVSESNALKTDTKRLLGKCLLYTSLFCFFSALVLCINPELIVKTLFGVKYIQSAALIRFVGLVMIPLALLNININYLLAINKFSFIYGLIGGCILEIVLVVFFHNSMLQVLTILFLTGITVLIYTLTITFKKQINLSNKDIKRLV